VASKSYIETDRQVRKILEDVRQGIFKSVYLLMGEEPFYPELVCQAIIDNCLRDWEKDFNETVCYGGDTDADTVITAACRFPMMAERQLVVLKEAQQMKTLDDLAPYCQKPLDSTVLVILMHGAVADKRKSLYKSIAKTGVVVESNALKDYDLAQWISSYYEGRGLKIDPEAAALLAESAGADLGKIAVETDKMLRNLPEGTVAVSVDDIERNVGVSRQFSVFELTRHLSVRDAAQALRTAAYIGGSPRFAMPMAVSALYLHFYRILKLEALLQKDASASQADRIRVLGVNPYFLREYETAARNYPMPLCMRVVSLLNDYDYKGKGGDAGEASPAELLTELVTKILNIGRYEHY